MIKNLSWFVLFIFTLLFASIQIGDRIGLNAYAINFSKRYLGENKSQALFQFNSNESLNELTACHYQWFEFVELINQDQFKEDIRSKIDLMKCSYIYTHLVHSFIPNDLGLASKSVQLYPQDTFSLFWFLNSSVNKLDENSKEILLKILSIDPKDAVAWQSIAVIYEKEGDISSAIDAYKQSCKFGDPGYYGPCYHAGRLFEAEGRIEEAIIYYQKSKTNFAHQQADRLEAELLPQKP